MTNEQKAKVLERLERLIPSDIYNEDLMDQLSEDAETWVLAYTNRTVTPDILLRTIGDLAIIAFNRLGTEGESGRSEGGESYSFDAAPPNIFKILDKYRLVRAGGHAHEATENTDL